jgi:hypothetical protein
MWPVALKVGHQNVIHLDLATTKRYLMNSRPSVLLPLLLCPYVRLRTLHYFSALLDTLWVHKIWGFYGVTSGLYRVVWEVGTEVSEDHVFFIFMIKAGGTVFLRIAVYPLIRLYYPITILHCTM